MGEQKIQMERKGEEKRKGREGLENKLTEERGNLAKLRLNNG